MRESWWSQRPLLYAARVALLLPILAGCSDRDAAAAVAPASATQTATAAPAVTRAAAATSPSAIPAPTVRPRTAHLTPRVAETILIGRSRRGRPISAVHIGDPRRPPVLVVGAIHGNETAAVAAVQELADAGSLSGANLWLVANLNPDGTTADTRQNAAGVDLNRNFPFRWRATGSRGQLQYPGPFPLSEPESQAMDRLLRKARPALGIWFHQALNGVDISQGPRRPEDLIARLLGLPERRLPDYRGSAVGYEDRLWPHTAFVVELPAGTPSPARSGRIASAILATARSVS